MIIANPIYDVIFKYLMENTDIAKDILSAILGINIVSLELKPLELVTQTDSSVRVSRIDFKAIVKDETGGLKAILIEIQKAKQGLEIPRFRRYIGSNYNKQTDIINAENKNEKTHLPISVIYFLGYNLDSIHIPVLTVERVYRNAITDEILAIKDIFVESLSHDLHIVQIPKLNMVAQTELEQILDVFNVSKYKTGDKHVLEYTGAVSNPKVARIIKYLNRAMQYDEIIEAMKTEDEVEDAINVQKKIAEVAEQKAEVAQQKAELAQQKADAAQQKIEEERREKEEISKQFEELKKQFEILKQTYGKE